ncbi:hypothetical protein JG688_00014678 [Phytophthora aleatoria]|uniref:Uncharacterized protein n=1 Tax=Phytophthora aleatoria TaxID=2496075 RepID=A0A8J5MDU5_9STRA|nr:hypothetical protein JG688_00014678 [Phytophthora aleatoria]
MPLLKMARQKKGGGGGTPRCFKRATWWSGPRYRSISTSSWVKQQAIEQMDLAVLKQSCHGLVRWLDMCTRRASRPSIKANQILQVHGEVGRSHLPKEVDVVFYNLQDD